MSVTDVKHFYIVETKEGEIKNKNMIVLLRASCLYIDTFFLCKHEKSVTTPSCFYVPFLCLYLPFSLVNPTTLNPIIELIEF